MNKTEIDILVDSFPEYYNFRGKQKTFTEDHKNATKAFVEKKEPIFKGR